MEGSENKALQEGLILSRGKMHTGLHFLLWFTGAKNNWIRIGFSFNNREFIDVHIEEKGIMDELQFISGEVSCIVRILYW